jgi:predicted deacylase
MLELTMIPAKTSVRPPLSDFNVPSIPNHQKLVLDYDIGSAPDGTNWGVSILVVKGENAGPVVLVNGGTHGDEYEGPIAIQEMFAILDPFHMKGTWLGIPVLNEPALSVQSRLGKYDQQDLARTFPGQAKGTLTEQIAHGFGQYILKQADYYADLHSAGSSLRMVSLCGYGVVEDQRVLDAQRRMAFAFGGDFIWGTPLYPGRTLSQAAEFGIPAIYTETYGTGGARRQDIDRYRDGIQNLMRLLEMLEGPYPTRPTRFFRETGDLNQKEGYLQLDHPSPCKGLFVPQVDLWEDVASGQPIGRIVDCAGRTLAAVSSRRSGRVILVRHALSVNENDPLAVVVEGLE